MPGAGAAKVGKRGDDLVVGAFTQSLPFDFNFFGSTYDTVQITTNGFISFMIPGPEHMDENGFHCN